METLKPSFDVNETQETKLALLDTLEAILDSHPEIREKARLAKSQRKKNPQA